MNKSMMLLTAVVLLVFISSVQATVNIDWVTVGNPGNADDSTGFGGVSNVYQISKYEVTAGQYTEFLNAVAALDTYGLYDSSMMSNAYGCKIRRTGMPGNRTYSVASDWANRPVNHVSWYDTMRFSNWLHNGQPIGRQDISTTEDGAYDMSGENNVMISVPRKPGAQVFLPTEDEWYKAAYHKNDGVTGNYFAYPTGSDFMPARDMTEATNPGNNANYWNGSFILGGTYYRTEVGEFELSESPYGTFDMGGNIMEWTESPMYDYMPGAYRVFRGGSCFPSGDTSDFSSSFRYHFGPYNDYGHIGFRVASVPEPCSLLLLGLGGLALRRRKA